MSDFHASVADWCKNAEEDLKKVVVASALEVFTEAQINAPVKDGTLRDSLTVSLTAQPTIQPEGATAGGEITAAVAGFELGQTIYAGFTVAYARRIEYGFTGVDSLGRYYDQRPQAFVRKAAQQWQTIVDQQWQTIVDRNARRASAKAAFGKA